MAVPLHGHGDGSSAAQMVGDVHVPRGGSVQKHHFRQKGICVLHTWYIISFCSVDLVTGAYSDVAWDANLSYCITQP